MDLEQARVISTGKQRGRAEVVLCVGEGSQRRSITRHIRLTGGVWVGRNTDDAAVARLDAAEKALEETERRHNLMKPLAKITIKEINNILGRIYQYGKKRAPNGFLDVAGDEVDAKIIRIAIMAKNKKLAVVFHDAAKYARNIRKEVPREVIFSI